ncbi:YgjV family protein [Acidithiobacillus ferrivorans]|nr:YgjV family protein [Acidithiobacillus ferrivorans]
MSPETWSAILGAVAIPVSVWRFQLKSRNALLLSIVPLMFLIGGSYWLAGEIQGAAVVVASSGMAVIQAFLGMGRHRHHCFLRHARVWLSLVAIAAAAIFAPPLSWIACIPFLAFIIAKWADHYMNPFKLRRTILFATVLWGLYAGLTGNMEILALEVLTLASNVWWLFRFRSAEAGYST